MNCPTCGGETRVVKSEGAIVGNFTLRLRKCRSCQGTFKTCEKDSLCPVCGGRLRTAQTVPRPGMTIRVKWCEKCMTAKATEEK